MMTNSIFSFIFAFALGFIFGPGSFFYLLGAYRWGWNWLWKEIKEEKKEHDKRKEEERKSKLPWRTYNITVYDKPNDTVVFSQRVSAKTKEDAKKMAPYIAGTVTYCEEAQ